VVRMAVYNWLICCKCEDVLATCSTRGWFTMRHLT